MPRAASGLGQRAPRCRAARAGTRRFGGQRLRSSPPPPAAGVSMRMAQRAAEHAAAARTAARACAAGRRSGCPGRRPSTTMRDGIFMLVRAAGPSGPAAPRFYRPRMGAPRRQQEVGRSLKAFHVRDAPGPVTPALPPPRRPSRPSYTGGMDTRPACARATSAPNSTKTPRPPTRWTSSRHWLEQAIDAELPEPNAMTLATVGADGRPSTRVVLIKGCDERGIVWYTNYASRKGRELARQPVRRAAVPLGRARARGAHRGPGREGRRPPSPTPTTPARPLDSRLGAWASPQSEVISSRAVLVANAARYGGAVRAARRRARRTGVATGCCPTAGSSGRAARAGCTTGCATGWPTAPGCASGWRPEPRAVRRLSAPSSPVRRCGRGQRNWSKSIGLVQ